MAFAKFENIENSVGAASSDVKTKFIAKVYNLLFMAIAIVVGFGFIAYHKIPISYMRTFMFAGFGVMIISMFTSRIKGVNLILFILFALCEGGFFGLLAYAYVSAGLGAIFMQAAILTVMVFGGLTAYVHITKKDFSYLGGFLFMSLFLLIGMGIVGIFVRSSMLHLIYSAAGVGIFSLFILYDTSRIIHRAKEDEAVFAAWMLFLDIINLFLFILSLLSRD
jgi:modulator of FtsH protease